ncbi:MAG: hypothetical protein N3D17_05265 [bacterium]|nr:hypothetical protein [bacterium]
MDSFKRPLIIDLSGKAGAGKTYVKDKLIQYLSPGYKCVDLSDYILTEKDFLDFVISRPVSFFLSILFVLLFIPKGYRWMCTCLRWWIKMQIMIIKGKSLKCDFVFIDEGLFRRISLIRMYSFRRVLFENIPVLFRKHFLYPDITVFVMANYDMCEKRRMERDRNTNRFKLPGNKRKGLIIIDDLGKDIDYAEKTGIVKVLRYNNEREFEMSVLAELLRMKDGICRKYQ